LITIIDASVALKWVCAEDGSDRAAALLDGRRLSAPAIWLTEAANVLWRRAQQRELTQDEAAERVSALASAPVAILDTNDLHAGALRLATELWHPVYGCLYLAAALKHSTRLITANRLLLAAVSAHPYLAGSVELL
jgi:predicted nucleic acid-binding protein